MPSPDEHPAVTIHRLTAGLREGIRDDLLKADTRRQHRKLAPVRDLQDFLDDLRRTDAVLPNDRVLRRALNALAALEELLEEDITHSVNAARFDRLLGLANELAQSSTSHHAAARLGA